MKNKEKNTNQFKFIVIAIVILLLIALLAFLIVVAINNKKNKSIITYDAFKSVTKTNDFYYVQNTLNYFYSFGDPEKSLNMLSKQYIEKHNITKDNIFKEVKRNELNLFIMAQKESYIDLDKGSVYLVKGLLASSTYDTTTLLDDNYETLLFMDKTNNTFEVYPDTSDIDNDFRGIRSIEINLNDNNKIPKLKFQTGYDLCANYYRDFIFKLYNSKELLEKVLSKDTKKNYTMEELQSMISHDTSIKNCSTDGKNFNVISADGVQIIINVHGLMNYDIDLQ